MSRPIQFNGQSKTMTQWCRELQLPLRTINNRVDRGWSAKRALSTPVRQYAKRAEGQSSAA